jgi:hypothetical protein
VSKLAIRVYYTDVDDMPRNAKMVLMALAEHHNVKTGLAWPSAATIARHMKISRRSAQRGLAWLKDHGYIKAAKLNRTGLDTVRYRIMEDKLAPIPGHTGDTKSPVSPSHQPVTGRRQTSDGVAQEPEREQGKEQSRAGAPDETPAAEEGVTCSELLEQLVSCGWFTQEQAENLSRLPDESLVIILQDALNAMVAADGTESE